LRAGIGRGEGLKVKKSSNRCCSLVILLLCRQHPSVPFIGSGLQMAAQLQD
jgi:hypothetical protein